jgi:hypothetical protein
MSQKISRRDFLKMLGAGGIVFTLGLFRLFDQNGNSRNNGLPNSAYAQTSGSWSLGSSTSTVAIHATLLSNGRIFYFAGSGYSPLHQNGPYEARVLDPNTGSETNVSVSEDIFCVGNCQLANGNVLLCGGTRLYDVASNNCNGTFHGLDACYEYDVSSGSLVKTATMPHGRWYPTCVTLADNRVFISSGADEYGGENRLVEVYNPSSRSVSIVYDPASDYTYTPGVGEFNCEGAGSVTYGGSGRGVAPVQAWLYPRGHLMPNGWVGVSGQDIFARTWDPSNGQWRFAATTSMVRDYGGSVLLPLENTTSERGKILIFGGSSDASSPATASAEILDFNAGNSTNPVVRGAGSMSSPRRFLISVLLPDGKVMVTGGSSLMNENPVMTADLFDPVTERWSSLPSPSVPRVYHGVGLLLPDGRVWTAGSTPGPDRWELRTEIFSPGYYFQTRPNISDNPNVGPYGGTIFIPTPDAANINSVSLVHLGCTTHHYDTDSRLLWLQITARDSAGVTVSAPLNARLAPAGYYMIHVLRSGVPSRARIIGIPGTGTGTGGGGGGGGSTGDTTPPTCTLSSPANNSTVSNPVTFRGTASDNVAIARVELSIDGSAFVAATGTTSWSYTRSFSGRGWHTVTARSIDTSGNTSANTPTVRFRIR